MLFISLVSRSHNSNCRENLRTLRPKLNVENMPLMIFVNKGIEVGTHALTLEIITDTCGPEIAKAATFIVGFVSFWE